MNTPNSIIIYTITKDDHEEPCAANCLKIHVPYDNEYGIVGHIHEIELVSGDSDSHFTAYPENIDFTVKWDGCAHLRMDYRHVCGRYGMIDMLDQYDACYLLAAKLLSNYDPEPSDYQVSYEPDFTSLTFKAVSGTEWTLKRVDPTKASIKGLALAPDGYGDLA